MCVSVFLSAFLCNYCKPHMEPNILLGDPVREGSQREVEGVGLKTPTQHRLCCTEVL